MPDARTEPLCCQRYGRGHDPAFAATGCLNGTCVVFDTETEEPRVVTFAEASAGMLRYARTLGPGSPACGEFERRALALLRGLGAPVTTAPDPGRTCSGQAPDSREPASASGGTPGIPR